MRFNIHLYPSFITNESRIYKESRSLIDSGIVDEIHIIGVWREGLDQEETLTNQISIIRVPVSWYKKVPVFKSFIYYFEWCYRIFKKYKGKNIDVIQCHSLFGLTFCVLYRYLKKAFLIYDTHELATEINGLKGWRQGLRKIKERLLIRFPHKTVVVSGGILDWYKKHYSNLDVHLIRNIPTKIEDNRASKSILKEKFKIPADEVVFIYQGSFSKGRGIELLLQVFAELNEKHIVFMGYGDLKEKIETSAIDHSNIHFHPAVKSSEIFEYTSGVDVGFSVIENTCLSHYYCLPNKFYEYTQAGLAIIYSDFPDMKKEMQNFNNGWETSIDYKSLKELIGKIDMEQVREKKSNAIKNRELIDWNTEGEKLVAIYKSLLLR